MGDQNFVWGGQKELSGCQKKSGGQQIWLEAFNAIGQGGQKWSKKLSARWSPGSKLFAVKLSDTKLTSEHLIAIRLRLFCCIILSVFIETSLLPHTPKLLSLTNICAIHDLYNTRDCSLSSQLTALLQNLVYLFGKRDWFGQLNVQKRRKRYFLNVYKNKQTYNANIFEKNYWPWFFIEKSLTD